MLWKMFHCMILLSLVSSIRSNNFHSSTSSPESHENLQDSIIGYVQIMVDIMATSLLSFTIGKLPWKGNIQLWILLISLNSISVNSADDCKAKETLITLGGEKFCEKDSNTQITKCETVFETECTQGNNCCADLTTFCGEYDNSGKKEWNAIQKPTDKTSSYVPCSTKDDCDSSFVCKTGVCCESKGNSYPNVCPNGDPTPVGCVSGKCKDKENQWCVSVGNNKNSQGLDGVGCCAKQHCPVTKFIPITEATVNLEKLPRCVDAGAVGSGDQVADSNKCGKSTYCAEMPDFKPNDQRTPSEYLCCPIPYSKFYNSLNDKGLLETYTPSIQANITEGKIEDLGKECTTHNDCSEEEFCDDALALNQNSSASFCYTKPICAGRTILQDSVGMLSCTTDKDCGKDAFCDKFSSLNISSIGVCCQAECPASSNITTMHDVMNNSMNVYAGSCVRECSDQCSKDDNCIEADKANLHRGLCVELSSNFSMQNKRCCAYERIPVTCEDNEGISPHKQPNYDNLQCIEDNDCSTHTKSHCSKGYCCPLALCPDKWTVKRKEKECTTHASCYGEVTGAATCEKSTEDGVEKMRCCPKYDPLNNASATTQKPYCTEMACTDSSDCGGHRRFCSKNNKCCYFGDERLTGTPHIDYAITCSKDNPCPAKKEEAVCVYMGSDSSGTGNCYYNPLIKVLKKKAVVNEFYLNCIIAFSIATLVFGLLALVTFLKYRSKSLFDRRKKTNKKEKKKGKKSAETTGGDTTETTKTETETTKTEGT